MRCPKCGNKVKSDATFYTDFRQRVIGNNLVADDYDRE
jgi:hypothetical protein